MALPVFLLISFSYIFEVLRSAETLISPFLQTKRSVPLYLGLNVFAILPILAAPSRVFGSEYFWGVTLWVVNQA